MSYQAVKESYAAEIAEIKAAGLWKTERVIASEQKNDITLESGANVVNMCANNYLGLANNAEVMQAASDSLSEWGFGAASVRFICGTQGIHKTLERRVSQFLDMEDTGRTLTYEDLTTSPEPELHALLDFLGEAAPSSPFDVRQVHPEKNLHEEQLSDSERAMIRTQLAAEMAQYGYV